MRIDGLHPNATANIYLYREALPKHIHIKPSKPVNVVYQAYLDSAIPEVQPTEAFDNTVTETIVDSFNSIVADYDFEQHGIGVAKWWKNVTALRDFIANRERKAAVSALTALQADHYQSWKNGENKSLEVMLADLIAQYERGE